MPDVVKCPHRTELQMRLADTDVMGHLHNTSYAHYVEVARLDFLGRLGQSVSSLILAHLSLDFRRQVVFGEAVHVETWVERIGKGSVTLRQVVVAGGQPAADVKSVVVLFDYERHQPRALPIVLRERLAACLMNQAAACLTNVSVGDAGIPLECQLPGLADQ